MIQENFKKWNRITVEGCLTFPVNLQWFQVLGPCSAATKDCRLKLGINLDFRKTLFGNQCSTFDSHRDHPQRLQFDDAQRNREAVPEAGKTKTFHTGEDRLNQGTIPMPTLARRPSTASSFMLVELPQSFMVGQMSEFQFDKFPDPQSFLVWKKRFKNQVTTCLDFPSNVMLLIEVEMVDSVDELKSSRSVCGKDFPNFEMLDAKIASGRNKIIQNSQFKKKVSLEEQKAKKEDRFLRGRQIAFMIYDYFRVTGAHDTVLDYADLFSSSR